MSAVAMIAGVAPVNVEGSFVQRINKCVERPKPKGPAETVALVLEVMEIIQQYNQHDFARHGHGANKEVKIDEAIQQAQDSLSESLSSMRAFKGLGLSNRLQRDRNTSEMTAEQLKRAEEDDKLQEEEKARKLKDAQEKLHALSIEIARQKMMQVLIKHIGSIDFEAKKDVAALFRELLKSSCSDGFDIEYTGGAREKEGSCEIINFEMLRECAKHQDLTAMILRSEHMDELFTAVKLEQFDIATDAFYTLQDLLTVHKKIAADFLLSEYSSFFSKYTLLLQSPNYVTRRQSLKMLGEILLDRSNFNVMTKYISDVESLKLMMYLLKDRSAAIRADAFQIFKVFVGNPKKPAPIIEILRMNKAKLLNYFTQRFNIDDEQFQEDKQTVVEEIQKIVDAPSRTESSSSASSSRTESDSAPMATRKAGVSSGASSSIKTEDRSSDALKGETRKESVSKEISREQST